MVKLNKIKKPIFASPQLHNNKKANYDFSNKISEKFKQKNFNLWNNNDNEISSYSNNTNLKKKIKSLTPNIKNSNKNSPVIKNKGLFKHHLNFLMKNNKIMNKKKKEPGNFKSSNKAIKCFEELKNKNNKKNSIKLNKNKKKQMSNGINKKWKNVFKTIKNEKLKINSSNKIPKKKKNSGNNKLLFSNLIKEINNKEIFKYETINNVNIEFFIMHCTKLLQIYCKINNRNFIYNSIKSYIEIIQNEKYNIIEKIVGKSSLYSNLLMSFKFELWAVMMIFYFSLKENKFKNSKEFCEETMKIICQNNYIFLKNLGITYKENNNFDKFKIIDNYLKETNMSQVFNFKNSLKDNIDNNFYKLKDLIKSNRKKLPLQIDNNYSNFHNIYERLSLNDSYDFTFECFYNILEKKGVIKLANSEDNNVLKEVNSNINDDISYKTDITQKDGVKNKNKLRESNDDSKTVNSKINKKDDESSDNFGEYFIIQPDQNISKNDNFLPSNSTGKEFTLVLDLDETLIHYVEYDKGGEFLLRPFTQEFLEEMSNHFEIVIFTAAMQEYADWILDKIEEETKWISYRLYRNHTSLQNNIHIKDLSKIGRPLDKTLIVDNVQENFLLQPENGICIKSWYNDPNDKALKELSKLLKKLISNGNKDIRTALKNIRNN